MGVVTATLAAAAISAGAQTGPENPEVVIAQPSYVTAAAVVADSTPRSSVTTHVNRVVINERPELAVVQIRGLNPWEPRLDVVINPWVRQDGEIYHDFREDGAHDGPFLGTNPFTRAIAKTQERLERARQDWLRDNGYVGGVATFVNAPARAAGAGDSAELPKPRATIRMPEGSSGGGNFRVEADTDEGNAARAAIARIEARRQAIAEAAAAKRELEQAKAAKAEETEVTQADQAG
ncbi:MAG: hypothetical protein ACF8R7_04665 [Phycisphaerales bacterium JB039]